MTKQVVVSFFLLLLAADELSALEEGQELENAAAVVSPSPTLALPPSISMRRKGMTELAVEAALSEKIRVVE